MAKQTINLGTGELTGDGESIRSAFDKINDNFTETYNDIATNLASAFDGDYNSLSNKPVLFSGDYNDLSNQPTIPTNVSAFTNDAGYITSVSGPFTGDITGSVFADDSTLLVDGVNATIPGYIKLSVLKTEVAASADFADFQARIAAL
jgi:hypothetical protein